MPIEAEERAKAQTEGVSGSEVVPPMRADDHSDADPAVETPVEARQGFLGKPVLTVLISRPDPRRHRVDLAAAICFLNERRLVLNCGGRLVMNMLKLIEGPIGASIALAGAVLRPDGGGGDGSWTRERFDLTGARLGIDLKRPGGAIRRAFRLLSSLRRAAFRT
jgi:hypothetical protein